MSLRLLLYVSLASLGLSAISALSYEVLAKSFGQPFISDIVIPWVKAHNLIASLIGAAIVGFFAFLAFHFFGER